MTLDSSKVNYFSLLVMLKKKTDLFTNLDCQYNPVLFHHNIYYLKKHTIILVCNLIYVSNVRIKSPTLFSYTSRSH